ncbi:hypothetical protein FNH22_25300 [Fulvivirga sp. M361]|uniref:spermine/spermidine synthase domain-containing protein n=1 Tax=Fulvivirga sp. M361 TaxID=2594266 RepID=UPI00117B240E|nr:hypothetical protein [Fulvivirga sp. M361]TRX50641.1 hypothetical protein FNH22_25300 [Fulvivirga sp. M361]
MKISNTLKETIRFAALCLILLAVVMDQIEAVNYYFGETISDPIIVMALAMISFFSGHRFLPKVNYVKITFLSILLTTFTFGLFLSHLTYRTFPYPTVLTYTFVVLSAFTIALWTPLERRGSSSALFLLIFLVGSICYFFIPSVRPVHLALPGLILLLSEAIYSQKYRWVTLYLVFAFGNVLLYLIPTAKIQLYTSQKKYYDPVIYSKETAFQTIDITQWKGERWFYYNNVNQFSSIDHWLYFEPMVHPITQFKNGKNKVLVIGGENGMIAKELLAYDDIKQIDLLPIDTALYRLAKTSDFFVALNEHSLSHDRVRLKKNTPFHFLNMHKAHYDLIFVDIPDPVDLELNQYYTKEFYELCHTALKNDGLFITQAGSPYFATKAFQCIKNTIQRAGFSSVPMHNQVLTLGEWGWVIGSKNKSKEMLLESLKQLEFKDPETMWLNNEAMNMMLSFGKSAITRDTLINSLNTPIVHEYYRDGTWKF